MGYDYTYKDPNNLPPPPKPRKRDPNEPEEPNEFVEAFLANLNEAAIENAEWHRKHNTGFFDDPEPEPEPEKTEGK